MPTPVPLSCGKSHTDHLDLRFALLPEKGVLISGEQTHDRDPWGGIGSTCGAALAMHTNATGSDEFKGLAYRALSLEPTPTLARGAPVLSAPWFEGASTESRRVFEGASKG